jgi:hypothetical protein
MILSQITLKQIALECSEKILAVKTNNSFFKEPYKHFFIDNFLPEELAELCSNSFPADNDDYWESVHDDDIEIKSRTNWSSEFDIPDNLIYAIRILNSSIFMRATSKVMQIDKLISDPYFTGGGLNLTKKGGLLDVHVDGNYHDVTGLNRRLNAILYLTPGWKKSWGGELGIYDEKGEVCVKKISPIFNRLFVFDTHDKSFHGLPDPINFPKNLPRKSILLYYYTKKPRPKNQIIYKEPHSALWKKKGLLDKFGKKKRNYY